jgi:trehalose 6-phosphate synthase/phosphatase
VNPYDVERTADTLERALAMPEDERRARMAVLRHRVLTYDVHWWARSLIARLEQTAAVPDVGPRLSPAAAVGDAIERARAAPRLALLLDYDGTLVPFAPTPDVAAPDAKVIALLRRLAARSGTEVHLVSGRRRETLERWFGALPVGLHAEHGFWSRPPGGAWKGVDVGPTTWREPVRGILRDFAERTPGSLVEEKTAGFAWHYRAADPEFGSAQAKELVLHLSTFLINVPVEILPGDMVVEVRVHGVHKGRAVQEVLARLTGPTLLLALGDDRTDEDLFAALPDEAIAVHVGPAASQAQLRIRDVAAARDLLARIAEA